MPSSCLVTGASGFIGKPLVAALLRQKKDVHVLVRSEAKRNELFEYLANNKISARQLHVHLGDFSELSFVRTIHELIPRMMEVYHLGADVSMVSSSEKMTRTNVDPTQEILETCWKYWGKESHRKLIITSTVAVYDKSEKPIREGGAFREYNGANPYGESKQKMEAAVQAFARSGLNVAVLRPSGVYGPGAPYIFPELARYALRGRLGRVSNAGLDVPHNICHVNDVVRAAIFVASRPTNPGETFNVSEPAPVTSRQVLKHYFDQLGQKFEPEKGTVSMEELSRLPRLKGYFTEPHLYSTAKLQRLKFRYANRFQRDFPKTLPGIFDLWRKREASVRTRSTPVRTAARPVRERGKRKVRV